MAEPAGLSACEAFVLISLPQFNPREALKYGFMGLLAQGVVRSAEENRPGLIRTRRILHLHVAAEPPADAPAATASLVKVVRAAEPRDGTIGEVLRQAMREYGRTLMGFVQKYVGPALIGRGLAEIRRRRLLGLIPSDAFFRTPAGDAERSRVQGAMHEARAIPQYLDRDPAQAAALAVAAGGAILLVEELRPHYKQLAQAFQDRDTGSSGPFVDPGTSGGGGDSAGFDFGPIDFGSIDFGSFDSFGAGFDAASDGGGADGGSSGC
ncbi:MAG TPA: hypothetical protein VHW66_11030 [Stellaceae bacterium]|jgi:hypothetical protein|nr:hypothetical protein [Stellaceae bacterium]